MNEKNEHEVERLGEIDQEGGSNRRRNLMIAGAAVTVTAVVLATVFTSTRDPMGESGRAGEPRRVALSSVGHPLEISENQIAQSRPLAEQAIAGTLSAPENAPTDANASIPPQALSAYRKAEAGAAAEFPDCHAPWWVVAGMGKVASDHAAGTTFDATGTTLAQIRGTRLDGRTIGTSLVVDTDGGQLDGDAQYDRAMGPLQFLPGMWYLDARDGNGDGLANPDNVDDAALGAMAVLCQGGDDLSTPDGLTKGLYRYTAGTEAVNGILTWGAFYKTNVSPAPATFTPVPAPSGSKPIPTTEAADTSAATTGSGPTSGAPATPGTPPAGGATSTPGQTPAPAVPVIPPRSTVMPTPAPTASAPVVPAPPAPRPTRTQAPAPRPEPTRGPVPTREPTRGPVPTGEPTRGPVPTGEPTRGPVPTGEPTREPVPTGEPTREPVPTIAPSTPTVTATRTWVPRPTRTRTPRPTTTTPDDPRPTSTGTQAPPTSTTNPAPTRTRTATPTRTRTATPTRTRTATPTRTRTATPTRTRTAMPTPTATVTATVTATASTPTATQTTSGPSEILEPTATSTSEPVPEPAVIEPARTPATPTSLV